MQQKKVPGTVTTLREQPSTPEQKVSNSADNTTSKNVLRDISAIPKDSSNIEITLHLTNAGIAHEVFATHDPPRVAVDLLNTSNAYGATKLNMTDYKRIVSYIGKGARDIFQRHERNKGSQVG